MNIISIEGFPDSSVGKESTCNAGDLRLIPGLGRSPEGGNGNPLWYSCLVSHRQRNLTDFSPWSRKVGHDWARTHAGWILQRQLQGASLSIFVSLISFLGPLDGDTWMPLDPLVPSAGRNQCVSSRLTCLGCKMSSFKYFSRYSDYVMPSF